MIGLLSSPGAVLAADEAAARRAAAPAPEGRPDATPVDAVHAVEPASDTAQTTARHHESQELTTDERLRQEEALHPQPRDAAPREQDQAPSTDGTQPPHQSTGGGLAGPESYRLERASQARRHEGNDDTPMNESVKPDPDTTIAKMRQVRRDALAATDPAAQDRSVATKAAQVIRAAEAELAARRHETLRQAAEELAQARDAAIVDEQERAAAEGLSAGLGDAPPPAAHRVSEYQRQAVISAGSRLSSIPPPPSSLDESI